MDCTLIETQLVGFHFGTLDESTRSSVETHLVGCPRCLQSFIGVKRAIEVGGEARPSDVARARLRAAVASEVAGGRLRRRRWLVGAAAAAAMIAALVGVYRYTPRTEAPTMVQQSESIDTARQMAANLHVL